MEVAAFVVSIVSVVIAAGALWYARNLDRSAAKTADAALKAADAAQTSVTLEVERRKRELTPQFQVRYESTLNDDASTYSSPDALLSVFLAGPSDLVRLDALTVTIRDDDDLKDRIERLARLKEQQFPLEQLREQQNLEEHNLAVPASELAGDQIFGPYRFTPWTGETARTFRFSETVGEPRNTSEIVRTVRASDISLGEKRTFELWSTQPPSWMQDKWDGPYWLRATGTILRMRLDCHRKGWEPWTFLCEIDTSTNLNTIEIP